MNKKAWLLFARPETGRFRIEKRAFKDDTGYVHPVVLHYGDALSKFVREPEKVKKQLRVAKNAGYYGFRYWTNLAPPYWTGREVGQQFTTNYWDKHEDFLSFARSIDFKVAMCIGGLADIENRRTFAERLAQTVNHVGSDVCMIFEANNESWHNGESDSNELAKIARWFRGICPGPVLTLTSPETCNKEDMEYYSIPPTEVYNAHTGRGGHWYDWIRYVWSVAYELHLSLKLGYNSEPPGPGSAVSGMSYQHEFNSNVACAMTLQALMTRQIATFMSGAGVKSDYPIESEPGFYEAPKMVHLLPGDIFTWDRLFHGGTSYSAQRVFAAVDDKEIRCNHAASNDGRYAVLIYGPNNVLGLQPERKINIIIDVNFGNEIRLVVCKE